jgi:1-acyl-sn-glycerol-3-phosphate acyltransferase
MGIDVEVRGEEFVRKDGKGFLILFNHSSLLDIPVLYGFFPRPFQFGAKVELFKIPLFGKAMELCGVLPIDRSNRYQVMKIYEGAIARVNNGEVFALAPEGTRQESVELGKFKRGPFEFAYNAKMEVVPTVVAGVLHALPKKSVWINLGKWRRKIILQVTPPVEPMADLIAFQERVRAQKEPVLAQLNQELLGQR